MVIQILSAAFCIMVILAASISFFRKLNNRISELETRNTILETRNTELENYSKELQFQKNRLDLVMEGSSEGFWDWNIASGETFYSSHWYKILGYEPGETKVDFNFITQMIHPDDLKKVLETVQSNTQGQLEYYDREDRFLTKDGKQKWLLIRGKIVEYTPDGKPARMTGIVKDISEKKSQEEEISYLSFHDKLTGLYNRAYFEKELKKCLCSDMDLSIIMGDVNGLKIANDVFGHEEGDRLLKIIGEILTASCRENDIVARYGGDEFAMILMNADEEAAFNVFSRIEGICSKYEKGIIKPSIAVGIATKSDLLQNASQLLKAAEENMYRNKLQIDRSAQGSIISSLQQTLTGKNYFTEEHSHRISEMCLETGRALNIKNDELDQLALLAILHDIGKVAVPDEILLKSGPLDKKEWDVVKQHTEIGYRIAKASADLSHIADAILSHHERYDGKGYPQGLKGEEIPLLSRIISVIVAYDAMTHLRPYREPIPENIAVEELKRFSGSQFDPQVVEAFLKQHSLNK